MICARVGVCQPIPHRTTRDRRWGGKSQSSAHLLGVVPCEAELARRLAPSVFAAVEVHAPGTSKGEGGTAGVGVFALASAGPAATRITR